MTPELAVTCCATERYQYAMTAQARSIHANLRDFTGGLAIVLVGDKKIDKIGDFYKRLFAEMIKEGKCVVETLRDFEAVDGENYKNAAQLLIAQMRTAVFERARSLGASFCWSLDSDVVPKSSNCFRTLRWILDMPDRFYEVAISPYPSQGGGDMLTGRGTPESPILQDFTKDERILPEELLKRIEASKVALEAIKPPESPSKALIDEANAINKAISECQPKGNVFEMNAKNGWRRRGWASAAYPALGRGCVVPSDWCGFGSTLMSRRALDECDFLGYDGGGTEDLFVVWNRWHQAGIRIGSALHEPSSHISRRADGKYFMSWPRFVTEADEGKGECVGHIRITQRPFYSQDKGEKFDAANDGHPVPPDKRTVAPAPALAISPLGDTVTTTSPEPTTTAKPEEPPTTLVTRARRKP